MDGVSDRLPMIHEMQPTPCSSTSSILPSGMPPLDSVNAPRIDQIPACQTLGAVLGARNTQSFAQRTVPLRVYVLGADKEA